MKRIITGVICLFILASLAVLSLPFLVSTDAVRTRISSHLSDLTGRSVTFQGNPSVSFSPFLGIEVSDFSVADPLATEGSPPLLNIEKINAQLDILPALLGRVEITQYQLLRPRLQLRTGGDGKSNWHLTTGALKDAFDSQKAALSQSESSAVYSARLGKFTIVDGTVSYSNDIDGSSETITNVNATLVWPETNSALNTNGTAIWRNENVTLDASLSAPLQLLAGGETEMSMDFKSPPLDLVFNGTANLLADLFVKGQVNAATPSISRLSDFANLDVGPINVTGPWTASGELDATAAATLLKDAQVEINGTPATGVVRLARNEVGRTRIDGTLAFETIDLSSITPSIDPEAVFAERVPTSKNMDIDFRISASEVTFNDLSVGMVAASVAINNEAWKLDIGDAEAFGGSLVGQLAFLSQEADRQLNVKLALSEANIGEFVGYFSDNGPILEGTGSFSTDLRITQREQGEGLKPVFNGSIEVQSSSGSLNLIDFDTAFEEIPETASVDTKLDIEPGATSIETLSLKAFVTDNTASISRAQINTPDRLINLFGSVPLGNGELDLNAQEILNGQPGQTRLQIGGTRQAPKVIMRKSTVVQQPADDEEPENKS